LLSLVPFTSSVIQRALLERTQGCFAEFLLSGHLFGDLFEMFGFGFQLVTPFDQPCTPRLFAATHGLCSVLSNEICGAAYSFVSRHDTANT
jgi:hypothetical protein